jgi:hypothetical protein
MGESKSADMVKDALSKIPDSDHSNLRDVKDNQSGGTTRSVQNFFDDVVCQRQDLTFKKMAWDFSRPGRRLRLTGISQAGETADKITSSDKGRGAGAVSTGA